MKAPDHSPQGHLFHDVVYGLIGMLRGRVIIEGQQYARDGLHQKQEGPQTPEGKGPVQVTGQWFFQKRP